MIEIPVFFASSEGQTARIAARIANHLRNMGFTSEAMEVASPEAAALDWDHVLGAALGASVHLGKHQRAAQRFARDHVPQLNAVPWSFFSVSLSAGSKNPEEVAAAQAIAEAFCRDTGLMPFERASMKGLLAYTQYGFLTRLVMRRIARKEGASTDMSRDHEYTDWNEVVRFADRLAARVRAGARQACGRRSPSHSRGALGPSSG